MRLVASRASDPGVRPGRGPLLGARVAPSRGSAQNGGGGGGEWCRSHQAQDACARASGDPTELPEPAYDRSPREDLRQAHGREV